MVIGRQIARLRQARGLTQEKLAERADVSVDVIRRLEQGQRDTARMATLKAIAAALDADISVIIAARQRGAVRPEMRAPGPRDLNRRELLRLITTGTAALGAAQAASILDVDTVDLDRATAPAGRPLDERSVDELAAINSALWAGFCSAPAKYEVFSSAYEQANRLTTAMCRPQPGAVRRRLCALTADVLQLAGEVLFDANQYSEAAQCYTLSATAAREGDAMDLWACAMIRHGYLSLYERDFHQALPLLGLAARVADRGDSRLSTRHWVAAVLAQAHAGVGDGAGCERALGFADEVLALGTAPHNGGWLRFDGSRLAEDRASCYVQQRRPELAEPILTELLRRNSSGRRRGIALVDLAISDRKSVV